MPSEKNADVNDLGIVTVAGRRIVVMTHESYASFLNLTEALLQHPTMAEVKLHQVSKRCNKIAIVRKRRGMSQERLASRLHIAVKDLRKVEQPRCQISIGELREIARILRSTVHELIC